MVQTFCYSSGPKTVPNDYKPDIEDTTVGKELIVSDHMKAFLSEQLGMSHQCEDYRELLELALIFIGWRCSRSWPDVQKTG